MLDITHKSGKEIMKRIIEKAGVFISNFRPYELKKFDIEYEALSRINTRLIYTQISTYGIDGPDKNKPGYDSSSFRPRSGIFKTMRAGGEPLWCTNGVGGNPVSITFTFGIAMALLIRGRTRVGQKVTGSLLQTGVHLNSNTIAGRIFVNSIGIT
ncbi:CoA transferase [Chloroflexota bacterium]